MSGIEFIGFLISLIALLFLFYKKKQDEAYQKAHPEEFEDTELNEEDPMQAFLKSLEREAKQQQTPQKKPEAQPPAVPNRQPVLHPLIPKSTPLLVKPKKTTPVSLESYQLRSEIETRRMKSQIENRRLKSRLIEKEQEEQEEKERRIEISRAAQFVRRLPRLREMIIYQEIIDKPKGLK